MPDIGQNTCGLVLKRASVDEGVLDSYGSEDVGRLRRAVPEFSGVARPGDNSAMKVTER